MSTPASSAAPLATARTAKVVSCPACGASVTLRALGASVMAVCPSCRSQLDVSRQDIQLIKQYGAEVAKLRIPLGARGTLRGQLLEVVGAMERSVQGYAWQEYLLFNPYLGFRWLVYDAGHWNLGTMVKENLSLSPAGTLEYRGRQYVKFQSGKPIVRWVIGEFYWRVAVGDEVKSSDYIAPPFMLSLEKSPGEYTWTQLEYLDRKEVDAAFRIDTPRPDTVAPNQPNSAAQTLKKAVSIALAALVLAIVFQVITSVRTRSSTMPVGSYVFEKGVTERVYGPFTFDAPFSLNELRASAPIANSWIELDCTLVNTETGEAHEFTNAFEFYSGVDSDGSWTEGSTQDTSLLTTIPAGTYNLVIDGASGDASDQRIPQTVQLSMTHDVVPWRNFWLAVLAIAVYPLYLVFARYSFERRRWSESDFNPYSSE